ADTGVTLPSAADGPRWRDVRKRPLVPRVPGDVRPLRRRPGERAHPRLPGWRGRVRGDVGRGRGGPGLRDGQGRVARAQRRLDRAFHLAAIVELVRVTRGEVRVFPLIDPETIRYPALDQLRKELDAAGIASEVRRVDYIVQPGGGELFVCERAA